MAQSQVVVTDLAKYGVISDIAPFQTPSNAWTSALNVSFRDGGVSKSGNRVEIMTPAAAHVNKIYNKGGQVYYTNSEHVWRATGLSNIDISKGGLPYSPAAEWFITELSNVLVFTNDSNVPQMLIPNSLQLADLTGWGEEGGDTPAWRTTKIRAFKNFLVAIGMTEDGNSYPQRMRWSNLALPNQAPDSWDATDTTKSAGFNDLSEAKGNLVDGLVMNDYFILYTTQEVFLVQYVGGNDIFSFRKVFDNLSILAPECVCQVNGGHFLVTTSDIVIHNGASYQSVITDRIKKELFENISKSNSEKVRVQYHPAQNEAWVLYPSSKGADLDRAAIFSLDGNTWTFRDIPNATAISYGPIPGEADRIIDTQTQIIDTDLSTINGVGQDFVKGSLFIASANLTWYAVDEGIAGTENLPSTIIKCNIDFDEWGVEAHRHKFITRVYPQFLGSGVVYISIGVSENPFESPKWSEPFPFDITINRKADFRATGRYISVRFQGYGSEQWTLLSYTLEGSPKGNR